MAQIMTVLGPIAPENLGFTSMHEHILMDASVEVRRTAGLFPENMPVQKEDSLSLENIGLHQRNFTLTFDNCRLLDENVMAAEMLEFKASGGQAVVDVTVPGLRVNVQGVRRISERTGVHVVTATGLYTEDSWPERFQGLTLDQYVAYMLDEIKNGIEGTGIMPGAIKTAITDLTSQQETVLRAAGRVANETGLFLTVHPGFGIGSDGRRIVKILKKEGVNLERVVIAHADEFFLCDHDIKTLLLDPHQWGLTIDYHKEILDQGANISIDDIGHQWMQEIIHRVREVDWQRIGGLVVLIKAGYSPQIVLGTDLFLKILTRRGGGDGYARLTNFVIPTLREIGVSEFDIRHMTIENPARLLAY